MRIRRRASRSVRGRGGLRRPRRREYFRSVWSLPLGESPAPWRLVFTTARRGVSPFKPEFQRNSECPETGSVQLRSTIGSWRSTGIDSMVTIAFLGRPTVCNAACTFEQ